MYLFYCDESNLEALPGDFIIYGGLVIRAEMENKVHRAMLLACTVIGGVIFLGAVLSAIFLLAPNFS